MLTYYFEKYLKDFLSSDEYAQFICMSLFPALAEIISKRQDSDGAWEFYVHYLNCESVHTLFLGLVRYSGWCCKTNNVTCFNVVLPSYQ